MGAVADGERTRFAFLGGVHTPAQRVAAPALGAIGRLTAPTVLDRYAARVTARSERS
ncbi:MAG: hypothetical protein ACR2F6_07385 [Mycobacteriales bacterium]